MKKSIHSSQYAAFLQLLITTRQAAGMTQAALAEKLGETQSFVSKCERGERRLDVIELRQFCSALRVTLPDFARRLDRTLKKSGD